MDFIHSISDGAQFPVLTAFLLGLAVAFHPCPLAANIAAMGYIAKGMGRKRDVLVCGLLYTLGRIVAYSALGVALVAAFRGGVGAFSGAIDLNVMSDWFARWGEAVLSPVLIIIGVYFLLNRFIHRHEHCPDITSGKRRFSGAWGGFLLGVLLALMFCPESAIVYFGMLMPMSINVSVGYILPFVFALATAIPTVLMAWGVAYGVTGTAVMHRRMHIVQRWINIIVGVVFICAGVFCAVF